MPIREYECLNCGSTWEVIEKQESNQTCPCGFQAIRKVSKSSFTLSGGGWAKDNYGDTKQRNT